MSDFFLPLFLFAFGVICLARGEIVVGFGDDTKNGKETSVRGIKARLLSSAVILGSLMLFSGNQWGWLPVGTAYVIAIAIALFIPNGER